MDNINNDHSKVILRNDPDFPEYLDFEFLRREGIEHLGNLSGKIWTDHNVHDPGITMLEMLCYAILDLGYRTQLPIEDLIAVDQSISFTEDNFFTPAAALSCNPVTILDYRKLLIDTPGIRNAWLEINREQLIYLNQIFRDDNTWEAALSCEQLSDSSKEMTLNGLYDIYLELERPDSNCPVQHDPGEVKKVIDKVKQKLHAHRNLCEDFVNIHVLCEEEISFCGKINLAPEADADKVTLEIYKALHEFLSPSISFYTLEQMLDAGIPMENIYSGRPYVSESFGFIKNEELARAERKKAIYISDLYALIGNIEGVSGVVNLVLKSNLSTRSDTDCDYWVHQLAENHVPVFCIDLTCFEFYKEGSSFVAVDKPGIKASFNEFIKNKRTLFHEVLDKAIPQGNHLRDLGSYYSIQNEFPRNYGIGEGGLSNDAPVIRQSQALQLKGYLIFFDQLLSNYLAQLDHIREVFSFLPDTERPDANQHTYFGGAVNTVPQVEKLIRFYTDNYAQSSGWVENTVLGLPVSHEAYKKGMVEEAQLIPVAFESFAEREIAICQFIREFNQNQYEINILQDECGYIFSVKTSVSTVAINGKSTYKTKDEAQQAAKTLTFLATQDSVYRRVNDYDNNAFSFELIYQPVAYIGYLQSLIENKEAYLHRRGEFLDHLLDRFAENFSDYALLNYGSNTNPLSALAAKEKENECKARLLSENPEINRNRFRAYNYQLNGWDNQNISGYEKRVAALSCLPADRGKTLCNFEIDEYDDKHLYELRDSEGITFFRSVETFKSKEEAQNAFERFIVHLGDYRNYLPENKVEEGNFGITVKHPLGWASYQKSFSNPVERDKALANLISSLAPESLDKNIRVTKHESRLILSDYQNLEIKQSRKKYENIEKAKKQFSDFASKINNQLWLADASNRMKLDLLATSDAAVFLNKSTSVENSGQVKSQFRWTISGWNNRTQIKSNEVFKSRIEALTGLSGFLAYDTNNLELSTADEDEVLSIRLSDKNGALLAEGNFESEKNREIAHKFFTDFIGSPAVGHTWIKEHEEIYGWEIWKNDEAIFRSALLYDDKRKVDVAANKANKLCRQLKNFDVREEAENDYRLDLLDGNQIIASSPLTCTSKEEADTLRREIVEIWEREGYVTREGETGFQYTIPLRQNDDDKVLNSYNLYRTRLEAVEAIDELFKLIRRKTAYFDTGDEANLNFSFMIRLKGNYVASHPYHYNTAAERDKAIEAVQKQLKSINNPFDVKEEFIYQIELDEEVLLVSKDSYRDEPEALKGFLEMLPFIVDAANFEKHNIFGGYSNRLILRNQQGNILAYHPFDYVNWERGDEIIGKISAYFKPHTFRIHADEYPCEWKYRYDFPIAPDQGELTVESIQSFQSRDEAYQAYLTFLQNFSKLKIATNEVNENATKIQFLLGKDQLLVESESTYDKDDSSSMASQAKMALRKVVEYRKTVRQAKDAPQSAIQKIPGMKGGNCVYRVVKKDECIAFHPCTCSEEEPEDLLEFLYGKAQTGYQYLEICLGGDICQLINGRYHYLIRDRITDLVYFKSYQGYANEEEARQAFADQYLFLICKASSADNYGSFDPQDMPDVLVDEEYVHETLCKNGKGPIAVVNRDIKDRCTVDQLADIACSYPIRVKITEKEKDCQSDSEICYFFHLVNFDRKLPKDCKEDWISKSCYDTVEETRENFKKFIGLLSYKGNYDFRLDQDKCCFQIVIREVLLESECGYPTQNDAWDALESMVKIACDPDAFHVYWNDEKCKFIIRTVSPGYYVGCHPDIFNTREKAIETLENTALNINPDAIQLFEINVFPESESNNPSYGFTIGNPKDKVLVWKNFESYNTEVDAVEAAWKATALAREFDFYGIHDTQRVLYRKNKKFAKPAADDIVAIQSAEQDMTVNNLVVQARLFPVVKEIEGFTFQFYNTSEGAEQHDPEVIFRSEDHFDNLEDVYNRLGQIIKLFGQKSNWEVIETNDYKGFRICLVDPSKVLAFHPRELTHQYMVEETIGRIIECINMDGIHWVEHILLRPQTRQDCECLLSPCPDFSCEVELAATEPDPCADQSDVAKTIIPGGDPYSFWATVVLPGWTKNFRSLAYRETYQNLLRKEAPAHVALNIVFVSPQLMCKFEGAYKRWLRWKSCKTLCGEKDPLCGLVHCLSALVSTPPEIPEVEDQNCDCDNPRIINRTNLLINYCFNKQRQEVYGQEFLSIMGLTGGFTFANLSHMVTLPAVNFNTLFPGLISLPSLPAPEEAEKHIRKRLARYPEAIVKIGDEKFQQGEPYERSKLFLTSTGMDNVYNELATILWNTRKRARSQKMKSAYLELLRVVTGFYLDQKIIANANEITPATRSSLENLASLAGDEKQRLIKTWNGDEWRSWQKVGIIDELKGYFES